MAVPMEPRSFVPKTKAANTNHPPKQNTQERRDDIERVLNELAQSEPGIFFSPTEIAARSGSPFNKVRDSDSLRRAVQRALEALEALEKAGQAERGETGYRIAQGTTTEDESGPAR